MIEDEGAKQIRDVLIDAAVRGKRLAVHSVSDNDRDQIVIGRVVRVTDKHAVIATSEKFESPLPLEVITKIEPARDPATEQKAG